MPPPTTSCGKAPKRPAPVPRNSPFFAMKLAAETVQHAQFSRALSILAAGIAEHAFPGASFAVTYKGKLVALHAVGRFTYDPVFPAASDESIYDLASLTKVIATSTMATM